MLEINPGLCMDGYKTSHPFQYPENTTLVHSNYTARKSRLKGVDSVVFFGLQYWLKTRILGEWERGFFRLPKSAAVGQIKEELDMYCPLPSYKHFEDLHDLGYLPIELRAVPEGTQVPIRVPMMSIHNTVPEFYWVTNMLETDLSNTLWLPVNSATIAYEFRKILERAADKTCDNRSLVPFQGHDFSYRGMGGREAALTSGMAHLTSFVGTDTIPAIVAAREIYGHSGMLGCSVPATEHSVMCCGGKETELETFRRLMKVYPKGILSVVSDTWDFWKVVEDFLPLLKEEIMARDGKLVIRPDSGDPVKIITGYFQHEYSSTSDGPICKETNKILAPCEIKGLIHCLAETFGVTINSKGFKELDQHIGAIYGDAITQDRAKQILDRLEKKGYASNNIVLGIGSYTYQYNTRDTHGGAVKATYCELGGEGFSIFKDPVTDDGTKKSLKGLFKVNEDWTIDEEVAWEDTVDCRLQPVFRNGNFLAEQTFQEIRDNVNGIEATRNSFDDRYRKAVPMRGQTT